MQTRNIVGFIASILLTYPLYAEDWLDLRIPSIEASGSLVDVARQLHKLGIRVCVEEVILQEGSVITDLRVRAKDSSLRELLDGLVRSHPDLGWQSEYFLMCPLVRLYRKSTVNDPRNPLNVKLRQFQIKDADLYDISYLIYSNSQEFRNAVNPAGIHVSYFGAVGSEACQPHRLRSDI